MRKTERMRCFIPIPFAFGKWICNVNRNLTAPELVNRVLPGAGEKIEERTHSECPPLMKLAPRSPLVWKKSHVSQEKKFYQYWCTGKSHQSWTQQGWHSGTAFKIESYRHLERTCHIQSAVLSNLCVIPSPWKWVSIFILASFLRKPRLKNTE